jgi:hypothetical protein
VFIRSGDQIGRIRLGRSRHRGDAWPAGMDQRVATMDLASVLTLTLLAAYLAAQPWSFLAAILLVTARGGVKKECAYVAGWVVALAVVAIGTVIAYPDVPKGGTSSQARSGVELAVGVLVGGYLLVRWRRPRPTQQTGEPAWMRRLDGMSPLLAFGLGAFLPSYVVVVAALTEMISSGLSHGWLAFAAFVWVLVASAGVAAPLLVLVINRAGAPETYQRWRSWILAHSRAVLYAAGALVSLVLAIKGLVGLLT